MRAPLRHLPVLFLGFLLVFGSGGGCDVFSTRDPVPPDTGQSVPFRNPVEPSDVLENIRVTVNAGQITNYGRSITPDFRFRPDPADSTEIGDDTYFLEWSGEKEKAEVSKWLNQATAQSASIVLTWTPAAEPIVLDAQSRYYENLVYSILFTKPGATKRYSGKCDFYVRQVNGIWIAYRWIDKRDGSANPSSAWLRHDGLQF